MQALPQLLRTGSYGWKSSFQALLRPHVRWLAEQGITPNGLTIAAMVLSLDCAFVLSAFGENTGLFLLLPPVLLLRMAWNAMDGMLAWEYGQQSALGMYLNELCDVLSDATLLVPFAFVADIPIWGVALVAFLITVAEMAGVLGALTGAGRRYDGPFAKSDRAILLGALGLWVGTQGSLPTWVSTTFTPLLSALLIITTAMRVHAGVKGIKEASCEVLPG